MNILGLQIEMGFKVTDNQRAQIYKSLEKTMRKEYIRKDFSLDANNEPEKNLICAMFHQAILDCFSCERSIRKAAISWLLNTAEEQDSPCWYAEMADMEYELEKIRGFLFSNSDLIGLKKGE